jgi:gamma-glutamylcysteine synthetase
MPKHFLLCLLLLSPMIAAGQKPQEKPGANAEQKKPTELTKAEKDELADLIIDLQNASLRREQAQRALDEANQALAAAQQAFSAKISELQKKHGAEGYSVDLRRNWIRVEGQKQP